MKNRNKRQSSDKPPERKYRPRVKLPLPFEQLVEGVLAVDPKLMPKKIGKKSQLKRS